MLLSGEESRYHAHHVMQSECEISDARKLVSSRSFYSSGVWYLVQSKYINQYPVKKSAFLLDLVNLC